MERIRFTKQYTVEKKHTDELGDALTAFFGRPLYWVGKKYNRARVERALHLAEKDCDHTFTHFMQNVLKG